MEAMVGTRIPAGPSFGSRWLRSLLVRMIAWVDLARVAHAPSEKQSRLSNKTPSPFPASPAKTYFWCRRGEDSEDPPLCSPHGFLPVKRGRNGSVPTSPPTHRGMPLLLRIPRTPHSHADAATQGNSLAASSLRFNLLLSLAVADAEAQGVVFPLCDGDLGVCVGGHAGFGDCHRSCSRSPCP